MEHQKNGAASERAQLRESWSQHRRRGALSPAWADFEDFYKWAIEHGWTPGALIKRIDPAGFAGPNNCRVIHTTKRKCNILPPLEEIRGGSQNKLCKMCSYWPNNCPSYTNCRHYEKWIAECWAGFNRYAKKYGGILNEQSEDVRNAV